MQSDLRPETRNSFWAFGEAAENAIDPATLEAWYRLHDDAYYRELADWFPELAAAPDLAPEARLDHWNVALRGDRAEEAIARAFVRRRPT
jgi:hypothetical protein